MSSCEYYSLEPHDAAEKGRIKGVKRVVKERESVRVRGKRGKEREAETSIADQIIITRLLYTSNLVISNNEEREAETSIALLKNNVRNVVQLSNTRRENF
jgi:hypothetical protein